MSIEGTFTLEVAGRPVTREAGKVVKDFIHARVRIMSPDAMCEVREFAGIQVIMIWTGTPLRIGEAQQLLKFIEKRLNRYFDAWRILIDIKLIETGG